MAELLFISLIQVVQSPQQFDGQPIRVIGVANVQYEATGLFISESDLQNSVTKNGVWISIPSSDANRKLHGKFVLVEGTFDAGNRGHLGMWAGSIKDVKRFELWSDPEKQRAAPKPN